MHPLTAYQYSRLCAFGHLVSRVYQAATELLAGGQPVAGYRTAEGTEEPLFPLSEATVALWLRLAARLFADELAADEATAEAARRVVQAVGARFPTTDRQLGLWF
jgi:hypothetical protein